MKVNFSPPYIDNAVIDEVIDTLKSGWITSGPKVMALEEEISKLTAAKGVLCVNSWTSGAILMLKWLGVEPDDEVIIPAYTYAATALAVLHAGAKPVMVDVCEDFNISVEAIRNAITPKTKAIIPVDVAGFPCDYDQIMSLVNENEIVSLYQPYNDIQQKLGRILVISDSAHSIGAYYKEHVRIGAETDVSIFSLHAVKNITTAEGGAICLNLPDKDFDNTKLQCELKLMTLNCQTKDAFTKSQAGNWKYDIVGFGMKINLPDINAAIGLAQIRQYNDLLKLRKKIFFKYNAAFGKYSWAKLPPAILDGKESSYHLYTLRINGISEDIRNEIIQEIALKEISVNVHFIPLPMLSFFKNMGYDISSFPEAYRNYACEISLPIYPQLSDDEVDYVINTVVYSYEKVIREL